MTAIHSSNVYLNVVPVSVSAGNRSIKTYVFLDQGSTTSLCDRRLLAELHVVRNKTAFSIFTLTDKGISHQDYKVNLTMSSLLDKRSSLLRDVLSVGELPVMPNPILPMLCRSELQSWPHLHGLSLPELSGEVMLLIGVNMPEAFWVMEDVAMQVNHMPHVQH